ncbi:MAG: PAS domain S-box protein [Candidatus Sulfotelmatobacter sp.]|jgi:PAS domain S-box-containing protein
MSSQMLPVQSEELFRGLFDQASLGIAIESLEGQVLLANPALCSMLGYQASELCGMNCSQFANPEDSADDYALFQELRAGLIDHYSLEKRYVKKDGSRLWGRLNVSLLKNGDKEFPLVFAFVEDVTERKQAEEGLATFSRRLIEVQDQERTRVARDLHDHIGQRVALLSAQLEQLKTDVLGSPVEIVSQVDELLTQTSQVAADVQTLSHELHPPQLEYLGIAAAMKAFCTDFSQRQQVETDFTHEDVPRSVPPEISLSLFRILQEALHNAAKHSGVRRFEVILRGRSDEIELIVRDAGLGFDSMTAKNGRGLGLVSMEERLQLVKGFFSIESQPKQGTTIRARVPLHYRDDAMRATG